MFAGLSIACVVGLSLLALRDNQKDLSEEYARHTRQDVRLIVYLLGAILVMMGFIADKIR